MKSANKCKAQKKEYKTKDQIVKFKKKEPIIH